MVPPATDALPGTAERLGALISALHSGILVEDEDRRIVHANETFCAMWSIPAPPAALIGADCSNSAEESRHLVADPQAFPRRVAAIVDAREPVVAERLDMADGRVFERDYTPITLDGVPRGHFWTYRDVTESTRAADELRRGDLAATTLLAVLADGGAGEDERRRRLLQAGRELLAMPEAFLTRLLPDRGSVVVEAALGGEGVELGKPVGLTETFCQRVVREAAPLAITETRGTPWEGHPAARAGYRSYIGVPVLVQGRPEGTLSFWSREPRERPFTARERNILGLLAQWLGAERVRSDAEAELRRSRELAGSTISTALDAIVTIDLDGRIVEFNPAAEATFGFRRAEVLGRPLDELIIPQEFRGAHREGIRRYLLTGEPRALGRRLELPAVRADGSRITVELAATAIEPDGEPIAFTAYMRDISERKRFERDLARARDEALEAGRLKSEFLAMMSHEIRTPMNGVVGAVDLLRRTPLDDGQRELLEVAHTSSTALLGIVDDVLDTAKIEAGKLELVRERFDLRDVVESAAEAPATTAREKGILLTTLVPGEVPALFEGDPGRLRQILVNLVGNAVKFTGRGEICVEARVARLAGERAVVELEVADTGAGISREDQRRLFEPFSQGDSSTTRRHGGTGLGLVICERLARLMGGGVDLRSEPGRGTTVTVRVDLDVVAGAPARRRPLAGRTILVAGPAPRGLRAAAGTLEALGARTVAVGAREELGPAARDPRVEAAVVHAAWATELPAGLPRLLTGGAASPESLLTPARAERIAARILAALGEAEPGPASEAPGALPVVPVAARVLVAEDSEVNRMLVVRQLERLGLEADVVADGGAAVRAARSGRYALVLMDLRMPELDGFDATRALRAAEGPGERLPIVAITANAAAADREACLAAGMDDHLPKPVTLGALREVLVRWLAPGAPLAAADRATRGGDEAVARHLDGLAADLGGRAPVLALIERWEGELPGRLDALRRAAGEADDAGLREVAHQLKGASQVFGAEALAGRCAALEDEAAGGALDAPAAGERVAAIAAEAGRAGAAMRAWAGGAA